MDSLHQEYISLREDVAKSDRVDLNKIRRLNELRDKLTSDSKFMLHYVRSEFSVDTKREAQK